MKFYTYQYAKSDDNQNTVLFFSRSRFMKNHGKIFCFSNHEDAQEHALKNMPDDIKKIIFYTMFVESGSLNEVLGHNDNYLAIHNEDITYWKITLPDKYPLHQIGVLLINAYDPMIIPPEELNEHDHKSISSCLLL